MPRYPTEEEMIKHLLDPVSFSRVKALQELWTKDLEKINLPGVSLSHVLRSLVANSVRSELMVYVNRRKKNCQHDFGEHISILDGPPGAKCKKCGTPKELTA